MMPEMMVVLMVMVIAVLSMIPRRVRAMNRVGRVARSQRQRVHPLYTPVMVAESRGSCNTSEAEDRFRVFTKKVEAETYERPEAAPVSTSTSGLYHR